MKLNRFVLPTLALGVGVVALWPSRSVGFTLIGDSLDLTHRDVRIFNNFSDAGANNNVTPDPNFPGALGATLAIWKACSEWGSEPHNNTGFGDPLQTVIGDGGANFDMAWGGEAFEVGDLNDKIHSEIFSAQNPNGTLAFTEGGTNPGWRIRYESWWNWQDGPGSVGGSDIQGIACHEYGHALGLDHSASNSATMFASAFGSGQTGRSIETDDKNGVQFIYGVKSVTKPHLNSVSMSGGLVIVSGTNFAASGNEIWFTPSAQTGSDTDPIVRATNVPSSAGGTQLVAFLPSGVGPGDVLVKSGAGSSFSDLSNAMAFDPAGGGSCPQPTVYCTSKLNSQLCQPYIGYNGAPSASVIAPFNITGTDFLNNKNGLLFYGLQPTGAAFQGGHLCAKPPTKRTPVQLSGGNPPPNDCTGTYSFDFNAHIQSGIDPNLGAGVIVYAQYWARDPADFAGFSTSLSDALQFEICQ